MEQNEPFAAWLEDDPRLLEEIMKLACFELPDLCIHFSETAAGLWECLCRYEPQIIVIDIMLPPIRSVELLSEGVALAKWIREGEMPLARARELGVAQGHCILRKDYSGTRMVFPTARAQGTLARELEMAGVGRPEIIEKATDPDSSSVDQVIAIIAASAAKQRPA